MGAPQVGDIVLGADEEKLNNLVKLLNTAPGKPVTCF